MLTYYFWVYKVTKYYLYKNDLPDAFILSEMVAVDTEAMGLMNNRDRLCLVQLSIGDGKAHLIQFDGKDYSAPNLKKLLTNKDVMKIYHYARFDIAIMQHYLQAFSYPNYCTKIASKLARTYTDHHSLRELCNELLDIRINKNQQSSDWGKSVLTKEQLSYASSDVIYLHQIKERLDEMLLRENRYELAYGCFDFLKYRVELDLAGWLEQDIFSHRVNN